MERSREPDQETTDFEVKVSSVAETEIAGAALYYEDAKHGLGLDFLSEVSLTQERIRQYPFAYAVVHKDLRRASLKRFPYALVYRVYGPNIFIVACAHGKRHPDTWGDR